MPTCLRLVLLCLPLPPLAAATAWTPATWRDQPAWEARRGGWTATVSPGWGRLVSLRTPDGDEMLHVAAGAGVAAAAGGAAGGHQAWLGPQALWGWPPPEHWEYAGAESVRQDGDRLVLELPAGHDPRWPRLTRSYAWDGPALALTVQWRSDRVLHALQVVQVRGDAEVRVAPRPAPDLPLGFAVATAPGDMLRPAPASTASQPCAEADGPRLRLRRGDPFQKLYLPPGAITADWHGWRLTLSDGGHAGAERGLPDGGLTTQAFLGRRWDMIEIEQASPLLAGDGELAATVVLATGRTEPGSSDP